MNDTSIMGIGNSRGMKTVPNGAALWPTWEAFLADFCTDGIPIDLLGLNAAGVQTMGTPYNKANVLPNATCTNLGIATSSVPKDAFDRLRTLVQTAQSTADAAQSAISAKCAIEIVSYTGTGYAGENYPTSITFSFAPKLVIYIGSGGSVFSGLGSMDRFLIPAGSMPTSFTSGWGFGNTSSNIPYGKKSSDGKTISWYGSQGNDSKQLNSQGTVYWFCGIG